jgi:hypothetical protein
MFRKNIGFRHTRRSLATSAAVGSILAGSLLAAPDPDIFDGRSQSAGGGAEASSGAGAEAKAAEREGISGSTAESSGEPSAQAPLTGGAESPGRDFGEIGEIGQGSSGVTENKEPASGSGSPAGDGRQEQPEKSTGGGIAGGTQGSGSGSGGSSSRAGEATRDFESIGTIGSGGETEPVEVNSSKASGTPGNSASGAKVPNSAPSGSGQPDSGQRGAGTGAGSSEPSKGSGSGDFGDRLPSGL